MKDFARGLYGMWLVSQARFMLFGVRHTIPGNADMREIGAAVERAARMLSAGAAQYVRVRTYEDRHSFVDKTC
jgi:hypothetical protein